MLLLVKSSIDSAVLSNLVHNETLQHVNSMSASVDIVELKNALLAGC